MIFHPLFLEQYKAKRLIDIAKEEFITPLKQEIKNL